MSINKWDNKAERIDSPSHTHDIDANQQKKEYVWDETNNFSVNFPEINEFPHTYPYNHRPKVFPVRL